MIIQTTRFGEQEVADDAVLTFPDGLPGFTGKRWVLLHSDDNPLVQWLQSADDPDFAVMTVDPMDLMIDYQPPFKPEDLSAVLAPEEAPVCRVIIRRGMREGTLFVNLFAPLFFSAQNMKGMQLPLVGSGFSVREVWPPAIPAAPAQAPDQASAQDPAQAPAPAQTEPSP